MSSPPPGYRPLERRAPIGRGEADFARAVHSTLRWGVQRGSGMRVEGDGDAPVVAGNTVRLAIPFGPLTVHAPARVVYVLDEPRRAGFAYGTLPGHPESGEEAFIVEWADDDTVRIVIRAFSRPSSWFWRLGYPVLRLTQEFYTRRYLRALAA